VVPAIAVHVEGRVDAEVATATEQRNQTTVVLAAGNPRL
jgi:hypothetical protein